MQGQHIKQLIESKIDKSIFKYYEVRLAYLFGSSTKPNRTPNDIDIALLFKEGLNPVRHFELATDLYLRLTPLVTQKIDIVILNDASPFLKYEVISKGEVFYEDNESMDTEFKVQTLREYFDAHYKLKIYEENLLARIEKGVY